MTRYKKSVEIEAMQWDGTRKSIDEICAWANTDDEDPYVLYEFTGPHDVSHVIVWTLEGDMAVSVGDFIIRGVQGEFYPCKPDIFDATYERVEDQIADYTERIFEPLTGLTPDQIADYLREHECLQPRNTMFPAAQCCPIAQYLCARIPGCDIVVGTSGYYYGVFDGPYRYHRRSLPSNVALFVYLHDRGRYPFLYTD